MNRWRNAGPGIVLLSLIVIAFFIADGYHIINYPAISFHQWRQSDCVAYAKHYYQHHNSFFEPANYNLIGKDGRVVSELPLLYFIEGKLCNVFGFHYWILRGVTFATYLIGLYYLHKIIRLWISNSITAIFPVVVLATSPYYYYYALAFLPNVPAISLSFAGLYYLLLYEREGKKKYLVPGTLFFIISTLLKPTDGGLTWLAYMGYRVVSQEKKKASFVPLLASFIVISVGIVVWYKYVAWYNGQYGNIINLQSVYPIWEMDVDGIRYTITDRIFGLWLESFHQPVVLISAAICLILYIVMWKRLDKFLKIFTLFLLLGELCYMPLWFKAFSVHDYYQLIYVVFVVFLSITVLEYYDRLARNKKVLRYTVSGIFVTLMGLAIMHNRYVQVDRYTNEKLIYINPDIFTAEPFLRKMGVRSNDIVLSAPDGAPNVSLAAFGNYGYSSDLFGPNSFSPEEGIKKGVKYLIINDSSYLRKPEYEPYTHKFVGRYKGIYVFKL
jgi:hypothetical protein